MNRITLSILAALAMVTVPNVALAAGGGFSFAVEGWYIIDFVLFFGIILLLVRKPAKKFLVNRHERVKNEMEEASRLKAAAMAELETYDKNLAGLDTQVGEIRAEFADDGEREKARILTEAGATVEKTRAGADKQIAQEARQLKATLESELVTAVLAKAETRVKAKLDATRQRELFDAYIANLEKLDKLDQFAA